MAPLIPLFVQLAGALIVLAVLAQAAVALWRTLEEARGARRHQMLRGQELAQQVAVETLRHRIEHDRGAGAWSGLRKFRVERRVMEAEDICSFYLVPHDGKPLPSYEPGQYLTFSLKLPERDKPLVRCYSLSDSPFERNHYRVTIKRLPPPRGRVDVPAGQSSGYFHGHVHEGDILDVKAPAGGFFLDLIQPRPVVLIAGGIGVTPMLSMFKALCQSAQRREAWLFYGLRHSGEHAFRADLERLVAQHDNARVRICYDDPRPDDRIGVTHHEQARVSVDLLKRTLPSNNYLFHICGPPPMMGALTADLAVWGVPEADIRTEAFGPASVKRTEKPEIAAAPPPVPALQVTFARSGKTLPWAGTADNLLEFAEAHGISLDFGCRAGGCGTCLTAVKSGEVIYVREPDARPEAGSCLACVSRPKGDLVLDA